LHHPYIQAEELEIEKTGSKPSNSKQGFFGVVLRALLFPHVLLDFAAGCHKLQGLFSGMSSGTLYFFNYQTNRARYG
jgi:hypothetical protein